MHLIFISYLFRYYGPYLFVLLWILPSDLNSEEGMADNEVPLHCDSHNRVDRAGQGYLGQGVDLGENVRVEVGSSPKRILRTQSRNSEQHETDQAPQVCSLHSQSVCHKCQRMQFQKRLDNNQGVLSRFNEKGKNGVLL